MLNRLALVIGRAAARLGFLASRRRGPVALLIETDGDLGFILGAFLRDAGFTVRRLDHLDVSECARPDVLLASIGILPESAHDTGWLRLLRAECPTLPLLVVASSLGRAPAHALSSDPHARVLYHPVTVEDYLAAARDLLDHRPPEAA